MSHPISGHPTRPEDPQCYNCGAKGHWAVACPEPTRETPAGLAAWRSSSTSGQGHIRTPQGGSKRPNKGPIITKYAPPPPISRGANQYPHTPGPSYSTPNPPFQPAYPQYSSNHQYSTPYTPPAYPTHYPPPAPYAPPPGPPHLGPPGYSSHPPGPPGPVPYPSSYPAYPPARPPDVIGYVPQPNYSPSFPHPPPYGPLPTPYPASGGQKPYNQSHVPPHKPPSSSTQSLKEPLHHSLPPKPPKARHNHNESHRDHRGKRKHDRHNRHRDNRNKDHSSRQQSSNQKSQNGNNRPNSATKPSLKGKAGRKDRRDQASGNRQHNKKPPIQPTDNTADPEETDKPVEDTNADKGVSVGTPYDNEPESNESLAQNQSDTLHVQDEYLKFDDLEEPNKVPSDSEPLPSMEDGISVQDERNSSPEDSSTIPGIMEKVPSSPSSKEPDSIEDLAKRKYDVQEGHSDDDQHLTKRSKISPPDETAHGSQKDDDLAETGIELLEVEPEPHGVSTQIETAQVLPQLRSESRSRDPLRRPNEPKSRNSSVSSRSSDLNSLEAELLGRPSRPRTPSVDGHQGPERQAPHKAKRRRRQNANSAYSRRW